MKRDSHPESGGWREAPGGFKAPLLDPIREPAALLTLGGQSDPDH